MTNRRIVASTRTKNHARQAIVEAIESRLLLTVVAPTVSTDAITPISSTSVTLNATVNPQGASTSVYFQYSTSASFPASVQQSIGSGFSGPFGLAFDSAGDVFVGDTGNHFVKEVHTDGSITTIGSGFSNPQGIAVDAAGDVFVADYHAGSIAEVLPGGTIQSIGSGFSFPEGVALDSAGDLFVADMGNHTVKEILPNGTITTLSSAFSSPYGVAVDGSGDVFVADRGANAVKKILPGGSIVTVGSGFSQPFDVDVDGSGNVFVADTAHHLIKEISPGGTITTVGSGFSNTYRVKVDAAGNLFVNANANSSVVEISPTSTTPSSLSGSSATATSATLTGLTPGATYYGRVVAHSVGGLAVGNVVTFTAVTPISISTNPINLTYGTALSNGQISGSADITGSQTSVPGTFMFTSAAGTVLAAGTYSNEAVTFTPTDTTTYPIATGTASVNVAPANPTLGTFSAIQINYGTALDNSQLVSQASWVVNGQSMNVPGAFSYTTDAGAIPQVGAAQSEGVTFTPTDATDYNAVTTTVNVTVNINSAVAAVADAGGVYTGTPFTASGSVTFNNQIVGTPTIQYFSLDSNNQPTLLSGAPADVGNYEVSASFDDGHYHADAATVDFSITPTGASITLSHIAQSADSTPKSVTVTTVPAGVATQVSYSQDGNAVAAPTAPGIYDVLVTVVDANYTGSAGGTLTISPFTKLANQPVNVRQATTTLTGTISPGILVNQGHVTTTLDGVEKTTRVGPRGNFSRKYDTSKLPAGAYTVDYTYTGRHKSTVTTWTQTLNVTSKVQTLFDTTRHFASGTTIPVKIQVTNSPKLARHTTPATVSAVGVSTKASPDTLLDLPADTNNLFTPKHVAGRYRLNLSTSGLAAGKYQLIFTISGDPLPHSFDFTIR